MTKHKAHILPQKEFASQLKKDFAQILRTELSLHGYESDNITDDDKLIIAYHTLFARRVESRPRNAHVSSSVEVDESVKEGYDLLVKKFKDGVDVNPHLSKLTEKLDKADKMFFDWGINHFHLGTAIEDNGFVTRTGPIVYAVVTDTDVYIVAVDKHGNWSNKELIAIIDREWPHLIQKAKVDGTFDTDFSSREIKELRNANINAGINLDNGHSYISAGGGYMSDGSWSEAARHLCDLNRTFIDLYQSLEDLQVNDDYLNKYGNHVDFNLTREGNHIYLVSLKTDFKHNIITMTPFPV